MCVSVAVSVAEGGAMNPAAVPTPLEDVHGDGRWLSMVRGQVRLGHGRSYSGVTQPWQTDLFWGIIRWNYVVLRSFSLLSDPG